MSALLKIQHQDQKPSFNNGQN